MRGWYLYFMRLKNKHKNYFTQTNQNNTMDKELENIIEKIKAHEKVIAIIIFGSYIKGGFKPLSDIDIAVVIDKPDKEIEAEIGSLYSDKFDIALFHKLPLYIQFEVLNHGKEIFVRDEKTLLNIKRKVLREYLEMSQIYERIKRKVLA